MRHFIALDGEGINDRYVLLASSTGSYTENLQGLSTPDCFDYLLGLPHPPKATYVGFFFSYDVNMMLRDIPLPKLKELWSLKYLYWRGYILEWTPNKCFTLKRESPRKSISIYDVGGFFQTSFVNALDKWDAAPKEVIERIRNMKQQRDTFDKESIDQIRQYCLDECEHLVTLMQKLETALHDTNLTPRHWQGAGSIAARLMQTQRVRKHHQPDTTWGTDVHSAILHSYFGGRVELFLQGYHRGVTAYDVNSAYPCAAMLLPSLHGEFKETDTIPAFGICHVQWDLPRDTIVAPFPFRKKGAIYWPLKGEGFYHAIEVRQALLHYPEHIRLLRAYEYTPLSNGGDLPFSFIAGAYEERAKFKREGNPAEKALKLGLNSLYGKLAQGIGYRGQPPKHRSYLWAGFITAHCRSRMFTLAMQQPEDVIMIATDGVFLRHDPLLLVSDKLGELSKSEYQTLFTAQPGVYSTLDGTVNKTRGFTVKEVDFDTLSKGYDAKGPFFVARYQSRRFQGLGTSLQRKTMDGWRTWPDANRSLSLYPSRKWVNTYHNIDEWQANPVEYVRHYPPIVEGMSEPYKPKTPDEPGEAALMIGEVMEQPDPGEMFHAK